MSDPNLEISSEAIEHISRAVSSWSGDNRDLALAMATVSHALMPCC
jgi:hypothetical protein